MYSASERRSFKDVLSMEPYPVVFRSDLMLLYLPSKALHLLSHYRMEKISRYIELKNSK